jgi:Amidohydrolase family
VLAAHTRMGGTGPDPDGYSHEPSVPGRRPTGPVSPLKALNGLRLQPEAGGIWTALASATSVNAQLIGRPDLGRVAEGCTADLLILGGNISDDPLAVWSRGSQRTIVQNGQVITDPKAPF